MLRATRARLLIGQEVFLPIPFLYLQDTFKSARAMAHASLFFLSNYTSLRMIRTFLLHRPINLMLKSGLPIAN